MNSLAKTALVVGGLVFLFKDQLLGESTPVPANTAPPATSTPPGAATPPASTAPPASAAPPPASATPPPPPPPPASSTGGGSAPSPATIAEKVAAATGPNAQLSADQWNWYWSNASGIPQTADLFPPDNRGALMSLTEYILRRGAAGLSGVAVLGGRR